MPFFHVWRVLRSVQSGQVLHGKSVRLYDRLVRWARDSAKVRQPAGGSLQGLPERHVPVQRPQRLLQTTALGGERFRRFDGAITSKIKHAIKLKTSPARLAQLSHKSSTAVLLQPSFKHPRSPLLGANAYMFYRCFFCLLFFSVRHTIVHKYETTVLGNGWMDFHETFTKR